MDVTRRYLYMEYLPTYKCYSTVVLVVRNI